MLCSDQYIRRLCQEQRGGGAAPDGVQGGHDVVAFPRERGSSIGDCVISWDAARGKGGGDISEGLKPLLLRGIMTLLGVPKASSGLKSLCF